jgi:hypothetical protein
MNNGNVPEPVDDADSKSAERKLVRVRIPSFPPVRRTWDDVSFIEAVQSSVSARQVLKQLGLNHTGSNYLTIKKHIKRLNLSTEHWTGLASSRGNNHKGGNDKLSHEDVLVLDRRCGSKEHTARLRRALLESGIEEKCLECGLPPVWNGKKLRLQIDHKNGNPLDNRPGNPRFLCPNCHSQTDNYGSLNIR